MKPEQTSSPSLHPRHRFLKWYHSSKLGLLLQKSEATYLLSELQLTYNQKILQVGHLGSENQYITDDFLPNLTAVDRYLPTAPLGHREIVADPTELPVATEVIDVLILPHILEFESDPHQILREADRVLKPEGRIVILGINPWSPQRILNWTRRHDFKTAGNIGCYRIIDWLNLLKFDAEFCAGFGLATSQGIFKPNKLINRSMAHLASAYAVKAIKRRYTLIPIKMSWRNVPNLIPGHVVDSPFIPSNRQ